MNKSYPQYNIQAQLNQISSQTTNKQSVSGATVELKNMGKAYTDDSVLNSSQEQGTKIFPNTSQEVLNQNHIHACFVSSFCFSYLGIFIFLSILFYFCIFLFFNLSLILMLRKLYNPYK